MKQLTLFPEPIEERYEKDFNTMKIKYDDLRKSLHARISPLQKRINDLESEIEFLKGQICKGNLFL